MPFVEIESFAFEPQVLDNFGATLDLGQIISVTNVNAEEDEVRYWGVVLIVDREVYSQGSVVVIQTVSLYQRSHAIATYPVYPTTFNVLIYAAPTSDGDPLLVELSKFVYD